MRYITTAALAVSIIVSASRINALYVNYHAPIDVFTYLFKNGTVAEGSPEALNASVNVCIGKEWYRYPSSYFLPEGYQLRFIRSAFTGQLPKPFLQPDTQTAKSKNGRLDVFNYIMANESTSAIPEAMNDENKEEIERYVSIVTEAGLHLSSH